MYTNINFKTKKALKEALAQGTKVYLYNPSPFPTPENGEISVEGPHYPKPHSWYARVLVENGRVVKVIS